MKSTLRRASASVAVTLCALLTVTVTAPSAALAQVSPTPPTSDTTNAPPATSDTTSTTSTTTATTTPAPDTTTTSTTAAPVATTVPTTSTTLSAQQLAALIQGLSRDVAQAQAVNDYLAARATAAAVGTGQPTPGNTDPVLLEAAAAQLQATAAQDAAQQRFAQARYRIGQVAIALYLGEQVPHAGSAILGSLGDRSAYLAGILDTEKEQAKAARAELARATTANDDRRRQADKVVQSRTVELQTLALQAAAVARAQAGAATVTPGTGPAGATGTTAPATVAAPLSLVAQESPTILGPAVLSADELAGWFTTSGHHANLTVALPVLAGDYESVGATAGVRADLAFAQSVLETAYFGFPSYGQVAVADNNFAGIGACDSCSHGYHFPDAATGVTAQMQLLHAYATTSQPVPGPLPGPFRVAGCCPTWMALTGVWATAKDYGVKILKLYQTMVQWALARRTAAAQL